MKPILVTGSHRSGSTWVGRTLSYDRRMAYIHEPFNVGLKNSVLSKKLPHWYQYITGENEADYRERLDHVLQHRYPLFENIKESKSARDVAANLRNSLRSVQSRVLQKSPLVKDPLAFFSAEWLSETYNMQVVMLSRHPAAFCSSIKLKGWEFDFNNFLSQPLLMEKYLSPYREEIEKCVSNPGDIVDQGILIWNCIHSTLLQYKEKHDDWLIVRHEDLSRTPVESFEKMYTQLGLNFTDEVRENIMKTTGGHNSREQISSDEFVRDSKKNITNWKSRLDDFEIDKIKDKTSFCSASIYDSEVDW